MATFIEEAKQVLDDNWTGSFTKPAQKMYPHQWSWDSAFIALGYAHYYQERAEKELRRLFSGQWSNGMVPHIVFGDIEGSPDYFPGPDFWQTDDLPQSPDNLYTSGICQPPVHATVVRFILESAPDREQAQIFAAELFPRLKDWHDFLYRERDPHDEGLAYIRHPWSSGQDNAPNWDQVLQSMDIDKDDLPDYERTDNKHQDSANRPSDENYARYVYLLDFFRQRNYDEQQIREDGCPFMVQDILFNSLLCRAGRDLAQIAEWLGEDPHPFLEQSYKTAKAVNSKMWNEEHGIYIDYDLGADKPIEIHMLSGFIPLFADIPSPVRAERMFEYLNTKSFCPLEDDCLAVPSYDRQQPQYDSEGYWRGPIWINMNWLLYKGLARYGHKHYDKRIKETIINLTQNHGFYEFYDPESGKGYGADEFSWSAALLLDLTESERADRTGE